MFVRVSQRSALKWYVCAHQNNSRSCNLKNVLTHLDREMVQLCTPVMVSLFTARGWGRFGGVSNLRIFAYSSHILF